MTKNQALNVFRNHSKGVASTFACSLKPMPGISLLCSLTHVATVIQHSHHLAMKCEIYGLGMKHYKYVYA